MRVHHHDNHLTWVTYHVLIGAVDSLDLKYLSLLAKSHSSLGGEVEALVKKDIQ